MNTHSKILSTTHTDDIYEKIKSLKKKLYVYSTSNPYNISDYQNKIATRLIHPALYEYDIACTNDIDFAQKYYIFLSFWYETWQSYKADISSDKPKIKLFRNEELIAKIPAEHKILSEKELNIAHNLVEANFFSNKNDKATPIYYKSANGKSGLLQRQYKLLKKEKIPFVKEEDIIWFDEKSYPESRIDEHVINFICQRIIDLYTCKDRPITQDIDKYYTDAYSVELPVFINYIIELVNLIKQFKSKSKFIDFKFEVNANLLTLDLDSTITDIILNDIKNFLKNLVGYIHFGSKSQSPFITNKQSVDDTFIKKYIETICFGYDQQNIKPYTRSMAKEVELFYSANDCMEYKLLKMFLPSEYIEKYFLYDNTASPNVTLTDDYFKDADENVASVHNNYYRQLILGFSNVILDIKKIKNFAINFVQWNTDNYCSTKTEWSQSMNNFFVYIFSRLDVPFPIRFILPEKKNTSTRPDISEYVVTHLKGMEMQEIIINPILFKKYEVIAASIIEYITKDDDAPKYKMVFYIYNYGSNTYDKKLLYVIDECGKLCNYGHILPKYPVTYYELIQLIKYMKGNVSAYKFKNNMDLPSPYNNMLFFTRYKINKTNKYYKMSDIISDLNLEKIDITTDKYIKEGFTYGSCIRVGEKLSGGGDTVKLELNNKLEIYNKNITEQYFKQFDDKVNNIININPTIKSNYISYLYKYPFTGLQQFSWLKETDNLLVKPIYKPFSADFYVYNEIYKLFLSNTTYPTHISIGISPSMIEVLEYENVTSASQYINIDSYKSSDIVHKKIAQIRDFIVKQNVNCQIQEHDNKLYEILNSGISPVSLVVYNNFDWVDGFVHNFGHTNIINIFIGLLFGLKNTALDGTFIMHFYEIINKPTADLYLIAKKYFKSAHLYYAECSNPYKKSGTYGIFKGFTGISNDELTNFMDMLSKLKKVYPNSIYDSQIYEPQIRKLCIVTKPLTRGKRKPYITGFLTDTADESYTEILKFNTKRYETQYEFMTMLEKMIATKTVLHNSITNEQLFHSLMYMRKWELDYNESLNTNKLIQTKIGTQILNDIYGHTTPFIHVFKSEDEYLTSNSDNATSMDLKFNVSLINILKMPNLSISRQLLAERNKYYNKHATQAYKLINAIQTRFIKNVNSKLKTKYNNATANCIELLEVLNNIDSHDGTYQNSKKSKLLNGSILNISRVKPLWMDKLLNDIGSPSSIQYITSSNMITQLTSAFNYKANTVILQDIHIVSNTSQQNYFIQLVAALIALNPNGNIILKLNIPLLDYPMLNMMYILYDSFEHIKLVKPITTQTEFYIIATKMNKKLDMQYLYNLAISYDKTIDILVDEYSEYFISQFKYAYETIVNNWVLQSRKHMFLFDNYQVIDKRVKTLINAHITEKMQQWFKNNIN